MTRTGHRIVLPLSLGAVCLLAIPDRADAYLDPGTGNILVQLLLGGVAGVLALTKVYWGRLKSLFSGARAQGSARRERSRTGG